MLIQHEDIAAICNYLFSQNNPCMDNPSEWHLHEFCQKAVDDFKESTTKDNIQRKKKPNSFILPDPNEIVQVSSVTSVSSNELEKLPTKMTMNSLIVPPPSLSSLEVEMETHSYALQ